MKMNINEKINRLKGKKAALFFDLDGTLIDRDEKVKDEDLQILRKLSSEGHHIFINTGRAKAYLPKGILDIVPVSGIICGASYIECCGRIIKNDVLSSKARRQVLDFCRENNVPLVLEGVHTNYGYNFKNSSITITEDKELAKKSGYILYDDYCNREDIQTTKVTFLRVLNDIDVSSITELRVIKFKTYAEALINGNDKANAMAVVTNYLGIDPENTISFGDSENDIEMLKASGISVAMPHAAEAAKNSADIISDIESGLKMIFE